MTTLSAAPTETARPCVGCGELRDYSTPMTPAERGDIICTHCSRVAPAGPNTHPPYDPDAEIHPGDVIEYVSDPDGDPSMFHTGTVRRVEGDVVHTTRCEPVHRDRLIAVFRSTH